MKSDSKIPEKPELTKNNSLGQVLNQSEEIKESVEEAATSLSSVNEILKQKNTESIPVQVIADAIVQNKETEHQVKKAAGDLALVNTGLANEVAERIDMESELANMKNDMAEMKNDLADVREDLSKSRIKEEETQQIAFKDPLTGLPNRLLFEERLGHGLIQAERHGWKLAVMFIDIDKFKSINDTYGHDLGDNVLLMVANRLQDLVRNEDMVSRWGGDEFVCLLLEVKHESDMVLLAEKMVNCIAEPCRFGGVELSIRASIGIATYPEDGDTPESLFKNADKAMYKAKGTASGVVLCRDPF